MNNQSIIPSSGANAETSITTRYWFYFLAFLIVIATVISYSNVLFNFFNAEDFLLIHWLKDAAEQPEMILEQFSGPWLGMLDVKHYRPLATISMSGEFILWGANGLGFRLVNLLCELSTALLLGLLAIELSSCESNKSDKEKSHFLKDRTVSKTNFLLSKAVQTWRSKISNLFDVQQLAKICALSFAAVSAILNGTMTKEMSLPWAFISAGLFALYPLHSESVNWIIGQTDLFALLFFLLSLWCHIRWQRASMPIFIQSSLIAAALAVLANDSAVTLPLVVFSYQLLFSDLRTTSISLMVKNALKATVPYWLILIIYLCIRRAALGTFIEGWDNSVVSHANSQSSAQEWLHALQMIFVPINSSMLQAKSLLSISWYLALIPVVGSSLWSFMKCKVDHKLAFFLIGWFFLSLAPSFRFLMIDSNLLNSQLAHFATAPLCLLLAYGLTRFSFISRLSTLARTLSLSFLLLAALVLYTNNQAWSQSGLISNRIIEGLRTIYKSDSGDPETRIAGVPIVKDGVAICRNALPAMTKIPFLQKDISNCKLLENGDQSFTLDLLAKTISHPKAPIRFFYWDTATTTLKPAEFSANSSAFPKSWRGEKLKSVLQTKRDSFSFSEWRSEGCLNVISMRRPVLEVNLSDLSCWTTDSISLKIKLSHTEKSHFTSDCDLLYTNNIVDTFTSEEASHAHLLCTDEEQILTFPFRGLTDWSMGGKCKQLRLILPAHTDAEISEIFVPQV